MTERTEGCVGTRLIIPAAVSPSSRVSARCQGIGRINKQGKREKCSRKREGKREKESVRMWASAIR